jgi:hypothetical protein
MGQWGFEYNAILLLEEFRLSHGELQIALKNKPYGLFTNNG